MGDINQKMLGEKYLKDCKGPFLEIGSKDYGNSQGFRKFFKDKGQYTGVDLAAGDGVDVVADLEAGIYPFSPSEFQTVICCSVLEHCKRPWLVAETIAEIMKPGGTLFISVPWVWRYHAYPDDYYRFSPSGIKILFEGFEWQQEILSTNVEGEFFDFFRKGNKGEDSRHSQFINTRKYLPYFNTNMIGVKK